MLILGGTQFIGRAFCEKATNLGQYRPILLNRGITNRELFTNCETLFADRNSSDECRKVLANRRFDFIVDFSCSGPTQIENVLAHCVCEHYTLISSSAVDLSWPEDELFGMAQAKLWCEHLVQSACAKCMLIRPGFVVGRHDYTNRFETDGVHWYWRGSKDLVTPLITVDLLCNTMLQLINLSHTGLVRAGYDRPRVQLNMSK